MAGQVHELSTMLVDANEDDKRARKTEALTVAMQRLGTPAQRTESLPVDVVWSVDGQSCMWDCKTPEDLIASVDDGRLHEQMTAMQRANCFLFGFVIEGTVSADGYLVGYGPHAWAVERFDDLLLSLQSEGAKVVMSTGIERTPQRLHALYRYTAKGEHGSYHSPQPHHALHNLYTDLTYRRHVEMLMGIPDLGETKANALLDRYPLSEVLGIHGGLDEATRKWLRVRGVGQRLADTWRTFLSEDFSSALLRSKEG